MRTKLWMLAFFGILAFVGITGCGDDIAPTVCSAANCGGCCENGQCQAGTLDSACGLGGGGCAVCPQGQKCETGGVCKAPNTCAQGCWDAKGVCQLGNDNAVCGTGGVTCKACNADQTCAGGTCTKACNATTCADGCCASDGTCVRTASKAQCGTLGAACRACKGSKICTLGTCADPAKTCAQCPGCCAGGSICLAGDTFAACGKDGGVCETCKQGKHCDKGACVTATKKCNKTICASGCCLPNETCLPFGSQANTSCGKGGEACNVCKKDEICQQGTCVGNQPCFSYCKQGCCTASGQCIDFPKQDATKCGTSGILCNPCGKDLSCTQGGCISDPVWKVSAISAVIAPTKADGTQWDTAYFTDPLPDPYLGARLSTVYQSYFTRKIANTLWPYWNKPPALPLVADAQSRLLNKGLVLSILDSDVPATADTIGECTVPVTQADLSAGKKTIATCGLASQVVLKFTKK